MGNCVRRSVGARGVVLVVGVTILLPFTLFLFFSPYIPYTATFWVAAAQTFSLGGQSEAEPCRRSLKLSTPYLPVTALASVQGSGNSWVRHLLQQLTGIYTGSVYSRRGDPELWARGFHGEGISNGRVIAIKTHGLPTHPSPSAPFRRAIVIIRDPFDAMFADFNRRATFSHTGTAPLAAYLEHWSKFSVEYATRWSKFHEQWLRFEGPLLFINFDDLKHSLQTVVGKLAEFLQHPTLTMDMQCALTNSEGAAKRRKGSFEKEDVFSPNLTRHINNQITDVERMLARKFPQLSRAVGVWKRNETIRTLRWKPLPKNLS